MSQVGFSHEALFHRGDGELIDLTVPFLREGVVAGEAALVVLPEAKNHALRTALGADIAGVTFADMGVVGRNPARIIPAWRSFVDAHAESGQPLRGIGEPINPDRHGAELVECHRHEALLNVAFADDPPLRLLCPYDLSALDPGVVSTAHRTHPIVHGDLPRPSTAYTPVDQIEPFAEPFAEPGAPTDELEFGDRPLAAVRRLVASRARRADLDEDRVGDLVVAVNEVATNSMCHGGGAGVLRMWEVDGSLVVEVRDRGLIVEPLVGRRWPAVDGEGGRGLWMANQVCDLVQVHSSRAGTAVRLHMRYQVERSTS